MYIYIYINGLYWMIHWMIYMYVFKILSTCDFPENPGIYAPRTISARGDIAGSFWRNSWSSVF